MKLSGDYDHRERGLLALYRPFDLAATVMRPFVNVGDAPIGGSEWIGKQLERAGSVSSKRRPLDSLIIR